MKVEYGGSTVAVLQDVDAPYVDWEASLRVFQQFCSELRIGKVDLHVSRERTK